ncbi:hypothetical protein [Ramlibacter sp.]|uniref:hypothetical protein n=1 Tax=Ramlibacter sp. TaxID=1917967 RepID=UPI003D0C9C6C
MQKKLKDARAEIEAVLKKHDVAGFVTLHAPGWGETFWNIWPSYSILIGDLPAVRIKSKAADYLGNVTLQREHQQHTAGMVHALSTSMAGCGMQFLQLADAVNRALNAEHTDKGFYPDPSRFNPGTH